MASGPRVRVTVKGSSGSTMGAIPNRQFKVMNLTDVNGRTQRGDGPRTKDELRVFIQKAATGVTSEAFPDTSAETRDFEFITRGLTSTQAHRDMQVVFHDGKTPADDDLVTFEYNEY